MKFNNPQHALRWAHEKINLPVVDGIDRGHAQASLILSMCEQSLPPLHMAYVRVQFGREAGGFDMLSRHIAATFGDGLHARRGIEQIVRAYCGEKIGLRELRQAMQCGTLKAAALRNNGYDTLDLIHSQAMDILQREMQGRSLLRYAEECA